MKAIPSHTLTSQKLTDKDVIKRILIGDKELYELLLRRYNQKLYRVLASYLTDDEDIADAMQDTYLKAYMKLYQYKFNSSFSTWLIRIGINEALARLKHKGKYIQFNCVEEGVQNKVLEIPETSQQNPENTIIQKEAKQILEKAILELELKYRIVYILREIEGMSIAEICECLDLSKSNVKVRLHRAKKKIKETLYKLSSTTEIFEFGNTKCDTLVEKVMQLI